MGFERNDRIEMAELKKVTFFINSLEGGGAERVLSTLLFALQDDFQIHLVLLKDAKVYPIPSEIQVHVIGSRLLMFGPLKFLSIPIIQ